MLHHPGEAKADWPAAGGDGRGKRLIVVLSDLVTLPNDGALDGGREFGPIPPALTCKPRRWVVAARHGLLGLWRLRLEGLGDLGVIPYDNPLHRAGELAQPGRVRPLPPHAKAMALGGDLLTPLKRGRLFRQLAEVEHEHAFERAGRRHATWYFLITP